MRIEIQANGFVLTEALKTYTEQRMAMALGWAGERMRKLAVSLSDINGPRGGIDKQCQVEFKTHGNGRIVTTALAADWRSALESALARAATRVVRSVRRGQSRQRLQPRFDVPDTGS